MNLADLRHEDAPTLCVERRHGPRAGNVLCRRCTSDLRELFVRFPTEDGYDHPADDLLGDILVVGGMHAVRSLVLDEADQWLGAEILGRMRAIDSIGTTKEWRVDLIRDALKSSNVGLRDAAIATAEQWGQDEPEEFLALLSAHDEPQGWLKDYLDEIVAEIEEALE